VTNGNRANSNSGSSTLLTIVIVVVVLYFARVVFIPLALAVLFSFLFAPLVIGLRHWGLGKVSSSVIVVLCSFLVMSVIGIVLTSQLTDTAHKLPEYQQNIREKLHSIRTSGGGWITKVDVNPNGGLAIAPNFFVPFQGERPHQIRLEGGDSSSDSFCYP